MFFEWRASNGQKYLYVEGENRYELGLAKGHGLKDQITYTDKFISMLISKFASSPYKPMIDEMISGYLSCIPESDMDEIRGIQDGYNAECNTFFSLEQIAIHSFMLDIASQLRNSELAPEFEGCTNFVCVNPDGSVSHGQNYDQKLNTKPCCAFVYQKCPSEPELFILQSGGSLAWPVGINKKGVAITVSYVNTTLNAQVMTPRSVLIRNAMRCSNARDAMKAMTDVQGRSPFCYNLIISDKNTAVCSQNIPFEQRITCVKQTAVQSNQYDYIDWEKYLKNRDYSKKRQFYSEQLLDGLYRRYSGVSNPLLLDILRDKPIICRETTTLFFTRENFGIGNAADDPVGVNPIIIESN